MDHIVVDSTPKGSAILAYGRSRGPRWNGKLLALIAGSFVVVAVVAFFFMSTKLMLPLPSDRLAMVAITPKQAFSTLSTDLRQSLPPPWRAAIETQSSFSSILGVALDHEDRMHAFALVVRTSVVVPTETVRVQDAGIYRLLTDSATTTLEQVPMSTIWSLSRRLRRHDLSFMVNGLLLSKLALSDVVTSDDITGVWDGMQGTLNIASTKDGDGTAIDAPIFSRLGRDRDDARPAIASLTSQGIDLRSMMSSPNIMSVQPEQEGGVILEWENAFTPDDLVTMRAVLGSSDRRVLTLPDESDVLELIPSSATATEPFTIPIGSSSTSTWQFTTTGLRSSSWNPQVVQHDPTCPGQIHFLLQDTALQNILTAWNVPLFWKNALSRIQIVDAGDTVRICVN